MSDSAVLLAVCAAYFAIVLAIGAAAWRRTGSEAEEYFLAGRNTPTLVLFMALFGTNVTPFVLMGIPGLAYHHGVGVFGFNAGIVALGVPLTFYLVGFPAWREARRLRAITPAELFARRLGSPALGVVLFVAFTGYTLPYLVTSVLGVALAVDTFTAGAVGFETASALILAITMAYTVLGGMRATMWTNVFQGSLFLGFMLVALFVVAHGMGGFAAATDAVAVRAPELLVRGDRPIFSTASWASWGLAMSLTVIAFPHMLVRMFVARDPASLRRTCKLYPPALLVLWLPAVLFGVWGAAAFPGLVGADSDRIFPLLVREHGGPLLQGLALAGILAAVMSTIDAQFLTLSSMLTRDALRRFMPAMGDAREVFYGRVFTLALALATWAIAVQRPSSIFAIGTFSFSGYVMLFPTLLLGLRWRRFTAEAGIASIAVGNAVLLLAFAVGTPPGGVLPVAWGLVAAAATAGIVPLVRPRASVLPDAISSSA
jgi:SSS family solute:Na+ symporter